MIPRRCVTAAAVVLTAACALVPVPATAASARPLGDFTVHRYDGLVAAPGALRVRHVEDLAEIPATQAGPGAVVRAGSGVNRLLARRPRRTTAPWAALVRRSAPRGSAFVVVLGAGLVFRGAASALG